MKKNLLLLFGLLFFYSCLNTDSRESYTTEFLPVDEAITPASLTFGEIDTITVKYTLPNSCYVFDRIHYEYQDTARIVAVSSLYFLDKDCEEISTKGEYKFTIRTSQEEDYIFKFFKGRDSNGENIFEEVIVPVN